MVRVYERSVEAWALDLAQAFGLAPGHLDALKAALERARAEGEQIGDDARALYAAYECERPALIEMKNEAIAGLSEAVRQRDEAAGAAGAAAIQTQRIVGAWLLGRAGEYGFATGPVLLQLAGRVTAGEPIAEYLDGKIPPELMARAGELPNAQTLTGAACLFCRAPSTVLVPACNLCGLDRDNETETEDRTG